jgi:hypothetical protein
LHPNAAYVVGRSTGSRLPHAGSNIRVQLRLGRDNGNDGMDAQLAMSVMASPTAWKHLVKLDPGIQDAALPWQLHAFVLYRERLHLPVSNKSRVS